MAEEILTKARAMQTRARYKLPEVQRREILAQSPSSQLYREIEIQRICFVRLHGNAFGVEDGSPQ